MKRRFVILSLTVFVFALTAAGAAKANFSGTWIMDASKTEGLPPGIDQVMTVSQEGDLIKLETKVMTDQGSQAISDSYKVDGKENDFEPQGPNGPVGKGKRTAKWTADGQGIEVIEQATVNTPDGEAQIKMTRKWNLSADGKTLVIVLDVEGPNGAQTVKRTFNKKA